MDKRTKEAYTHLFRYIDENIFKFEPAGFMSDFEVALQNSLRDVFPSATTYGCWFHFCQAIRRMVVKKFPKLAERVREDRHASKLYHKILSLPLLPARDIETMFYCIQVEASKLENSAAICLTLSK